MKKSYQFFEGLRIAMLTTFISGFLNAYTYNNQGGVFAGAQTGNIINMVIDLTRGKIVEALFYLFPIFSFILGQFLAYFGRKWLNNDKKWPITAVKLMACLLFLAVMLIPFSLNYLVIVLLAVFASIQLDAFPKVRGIIYANVMMTGNLKHASSFWIRGFIEKDDEVKRTSYCTMIALTCFMLGVAVSSIISVYFLEYSLYFLAIPMLILYYFLEHRKTLR